MRTGYHSGMIIALVDDLMFGSKIRAAADHAKTSVTFVRSRDALLPELLAARPSLVILDLDRDALDPIGAIRAIRGDSRVRSTRLVAFVRHTSAEAIARAREAGVDQVLARSAFFPALAGMLAGAAPASSGAGGSNESGVA